MQFFSAPVFVGLGIYATMQQSADSLRSIMDVSPSSSVREISWIIVAMLFAEGYGNFFLAYATWNGTSTTSAPNVEFKAEYECSKKWVPRTKNNEHVATSRLILTSSYLAVAAFNVIIPTLRLLLFAWAIRGNYLTSSLVHVMSWLLALELFKLIVIRMS